MYIKTMENAYSLAGKNAIITGGSKGIGFGIATAFAQQGANIAIMARDEASGRKAAEELASKYPGTFRYYKCDIGDMASCKSAAEAAIRDFQYIDILVNNAGIAVTGNLLDMGEDLKPWIDCFNVDLIGAIRMSYFIGKHMKETMRGGRIVNISSNASESPSRTVNMTAYCAAKAGINLFTKGFALEMAPYNVRVNAIAPGFTISNFMGNIPEDVVDTIPMAQEIPIKRLGRPLEVGALAVFLSSPASDNITGEVVFIDGGHSLAI
jgi:NAD(P)-dependent dehydrogenase (short-subunit alcohol dehydrogenase family)